MQLLGLSFGSRTSRASAALVALLLCAMAPVAAAPDAPSGAGSVTVIGEVARPGTYPLVEGDTASRLIARAGSLTACAARQRITVRRDGRTLPVSLDAAATQGGSGEDPVLRAGDVIHVPTAARILVVGAVGQPGPVSATTDATLVDVLLRAGGFLPHAKLGESVVVRETDRGTVFLPVPAQVDRPFAFRDGDTLVVPGSPPRSTGIRPADPVRSPRVVTPTRDVTRHPSHVVPLGPGKWIYQPSPKVDWPGRPAPLPQAPR